MIKFFLTYTKDQRKSEKDEMWVRLSVIFETINKRFTFYNMINFFITTQKPFYITILLFLHPIHKSEFV